MKKILIVAISSLFAISSLYADSDCHIEQGKKADSYKVIDSSNKYMGYISLNKDGTWFAWMENQGASNRNFAKKSDAIEVVCNNSQE